MRIAYLVGRYPAISHTFIAREVQALRGRGLEVETLSIWPTDPAELLTPEDREEARRTTSLLASPWRLAGQNVLALLRAPLAYLRGAGDGWALGNPGLRGRLLGLLWHLEATLLARELRRREIPHVHVHLGGTATSVALLAARQARRRGQRLTWSFTTHGPAEFFDVTAQQLSRKLGEADFAVAISDFARSQLLGLSDLEHHPKVHVVHCGVSAEIFRPPPERTGRDGALRVLTVARLARVKGHGVLFEAIAELTRSGVPVQATIIGDGPTREQLEARVAELGIGADVTFTGSVGQDEIPGYYADADVFVLSSFAEGVPVVLMEAMATGLPVVASAVMGVGELVHDGVNGLLVRPARGDLVAEALRKLHEQPELRHELGRAGRETVMAEFDIAESAARLERLFRAVADGRVAEVEAG